MYQINRLWTLNLQNVVCQLHLNKAGWMWERQGPIQYPQYLLCLTGWMIKNYLLDGLITPPLSNSTSFVATGPPSSFCKLPSFQHMKLFPASMPLWTQFPQHGMLKSTQPLGYCSRCSQVSPLLWIFVLTLLPR